MWKWFRSQPKIETVKKIVAEPREHHSAHQFTKSNDEMTAKLNTIGKQMKELQRLEQMEKKVQELDRLEQMEKQLHHLQEKKPDDSKEMMSKLEQSLQTIERLQKKFEQLEAHSPSYMEKKLDGMEQKLESLINQPPIIVEKLFVEKIMFDKVDLSNNFGQLGIKDLSGRLNIGKTFGLADEDLKKTLSKESKQSIEEENPTGEVSITNMTQRPSISIGQHDEKT